MFKTYLSVAVATAVTLSSGAAFAANPNALITITQDDGRIWQEDVTKLLVVDANNNFTMVNGAGTTGYFQDGQFKANVDLSAHVDFWQWKTDANGSYWNWHTAETNSGATPTTTTSSDPWMAVLNLKNVSGHGDPDLSYAVSAVNNNTRTQTYTFAVSEEIFPTVSSANAVYADVAGGLTTRDGNVTIAPFGTATAIQQFQLSADGGMTFVNAGVDVGPKLTAIGTTTYGTFAANAAGPTGQTWNFMQITTKFTLTGGDSASLAGFASITPVPEPESYAMMLSGLTLLSFLARRRNNV